MQTNKLFYMANQIASFFVTQPGTDQAESVAAHMRDFWEPRMRDQFLSMIDDGAEGLSPLAREAAELLRQPV